MPATPHFRRLHFSLSHRMAAFVSEKLFRNITYTVRHGLIAGMKRKGGLGFLPAVLAPSGYHAQEEQFLRTLDVQGKVVYELGAFQGIMTLFFARQAKAVVTYEPLPENYRRVLENVQLNDLTNVTVLNRALGNQDSDMTLVYDPRMAGAASADPSIRAQIQGSVPEAKTVEVPVVRLDDDIARHRLPPADLIILDVEGMELAALEGMRKTLAGSHPALYLEMHGATEDEKRRRVEEIVEFLTSMGYARILHVESGLTLTPANSDIGRSGHLYCTSGR
jgi:FkbM family methyltransferase